MLISKGGKIQFNIYYTLLKNNSEETNMSDFLKNMSKSKKKGYSV